MPPSVVGRQPSSGPPPQRGLHGQWVRLRVVKVKPPPLDVPRLAELGLGGCGLRPWAVELGLAEPGEGRRRHSSLVACSGPLLADERFTETNATCGGGMTVLHTAVQKGHVEVCRALLAHDRFTQANARDSDCSGSLKMIDSEATS